MRKFPGFQVNGAPFFALGAQAHNSSSYSEEMFAGAVQAALALGCNTVEAPVYWEKVEPREGAFDFSMVDMMLRLCREANLRLVVLWFGSWKNGEMSYCPEFVKRDTGRFQRVLGADGVKMTDLSAHYDANREADGKAFAALAGYLRQVDGAEGTVIALQVENEPGYLRTDRDYSPRALEDQQAPVPAGLLAFLDGRRNSDPYRDWERHGKPADAGWYETFGVNGYEYCEAYYLARYIDGVTAAGKEKYGLPMYVNVWLTTTPWNIPGLNYPGGGAVRRVLDIWQYAVEFIDFIAPDIYETNTYRFERICDTYNRPDNALFVPEAFRDESSACNMFYAIASGAIGYACFGSELVFDNDGSIRPESLALIDSNRVVQNAMPLILKHRATGRMYPVVRHEGAEYDTYTFERYLGSVSYVTDHYSGSMDYHNNRDRYAGRTQPPRGLIFEEDATTFYLAGNYHLRLAEKSSPARNQTDRYLNIVDHVAVEEGHFGADGQFVTDRVRNGDELIFGAFWVTPKCGVVRVKLL